MRSFPCENAAAKRWIEHYGKQYAHLGITVLGDDLYCHQPLCELLLQHELNFILVCQPASHKTLYNWLEGLPLDTLSVKHWKGKVCEIYTYRYVNQLPLRDGEDALLVNWCELTITRPDGTKVYKNAFATNYPLPGSERRGTGIRWSCPLEDRKRKQQYTQNQRLQLRA